MALSFLQTQGHCPTCLYYAVSRSLPSTCTSTHISTVCLKLLFVYFSQQILSEISKGLARPAVVSLPVFSSHHASKALQVLTDVLPALQSLVKPGSSCLVFQAYWMRSTPFLGTLPSCSRSSLILSPLIRRPQSLPAQAPGPSSFHCHPG